MTQHCIEFKLNPLDRDVQDPEQWLKTGFRAIFDHIVANLSGNDKVGMTLTADDFDTDFHIPFKAVPQLKFDNLWKLLQQLHQSKKEAVEGDTFKIITTSFTPFRGAGRTSEQFVTFSEECRKRKGIITIKNKDNLCLVRALVVAIAYAMNVPYLRQVRRNVAKRQDQEAMQLIEKVGGRIPAEGAGIEELNKFQEHLKEYKITVSEYGSKGRNVLFEGPDSKYKLNLLHHKNHYNVITSLTGAFNCSYFCDRCHLPYDHKDKHRCSGQCPGCRREPPCEKVSDEICCAECNRKFRGQKCFDSHKASSAKSKSLCERVKRCGECLKTVKSDRVHVCEEIFCTVCKKHQPSGHQCFIQIDTGKPNLKETLFVFYDLETRQDEQNARGESIHTPTLCVFQQRCNECFEVENQVIECTKCGIRRHVVSGKDVIHLFMQQLFQLNNKFKSTVAIAHNGGSYDHQFILRYILENTDLKPDVIMRGSKILMMTVGKLKFLDSINYMPMKLAALPKAFGLTELKKGYFPHFFNTLANENYIGPLPNLEFYKPDAMKSSDRRDFLQWYEKNKHTTFDLAREMIEYCISDVDILTQACLTFHKLVMEQGNVSPFTEAITIPGACNKLFRRNFLKPFTIGVIPKNGYRCVDNQSKIGLQWLICEEEKNGINIIHAGKQREAVIGGMKVDGFNAEMNHVYEFLGCYFHGCPKCFSNIDRDTPIHEDPSDTMNARYERTVKKLERLKSLGYTVISIWEHQFKEVLNQDKALKESLETHPLLINLPLNPRESFYGGRTGCTKSYYKVKPGEKIKYVDVCSLYPYVCKYGKFPIGHPKVHVGRECQSLDLQNIDGLIKCKILPPQDLYHPVIPLKGNDKLMFVLCHKCGEQMNKGDCNHSVEERALTGTWVMDEVRKAVQKGYKILEIFEIWEYNVTQYNKSINTEGGLFTTMMNKFLKIKQEASGWPSTCISQHQKEAYVKEFLQKEGIQMEDEKIVKNSGLRSLAKLMLNSFWGKFGQRENQTKQSIIRQPSELYKLDNDPSLEIKHLTIINEDVLIVSWEYKDEAADSLSTVNVVVAAYVTAQARLKLYSYLEKLGDRVLYYDTDSIIYISREGEWDIPTGTSLGEMTNELEEYGPESYIVEFTSAGPKNYSFTVYSPITGKEHYICKVKGFNLNYQVSKFISPETMKHMIQNPSSKPISIEFDQIRRTQSHHLVTKTESKIYRPCLEKRKFGKDHDSTPYGYKRRRSN